MSIADYSSQRVRKVTVSTGIITTYAGSGGAGGFSGDGGVASSAKLNCPTAVFVDSAGIFFVILDEKLLISTINQQAICILVIALTIVSAR